MTLVLLSANDRQPTVRDNLRSRLSLRAKHERFLAAAGIIDVAQNAGQDSTHVGEASHGGARGRGRSEVDMPEGSPTQPADSTNPAAQSWRR